MVATTYYKVFIVHTVRALNVPICMMPIGVIGKVTGSVADLGVVRWVRTNHPSSGRNINLQTYIIILFSNHYRSSACSGELASFIVASYY